MPITSYNTDDGFVCIAISERFDFSLHQHFRQAYEGSKAQGTKFRIDLSQTTYMDSSALGMILLLKDHVENIKGEVVISRPNDSVKKILEIAQFNRLLTIEN